MRAFNGSLSLMIAVFMVSVLTFGIMAADENAPVKPGVEMLFESEKNTKLIMGKRVGLITNPTGIDRNFNSTIDLLAEHPACELVALFGPEHGLRGDYFAGAQVKESVDEKTGVTIYSLYGSGKHAPSQDILKKLDILIYDIQDIGVRPYTYISTMLASMEAAKEAGISFMVLDRPCPMGGDVIDGPVLDPEFKSFIGYWTIPYTYGLTPGELAIFYNKEEKLGADLHVIKMEGWKRGMTYDETGLPWVPPSTHIPRWDTSIFCAITGGMGELHTVNEGVGYTLPFEIVGAPWIDGTKFADELNSRGIPGVKFRPISYKPAYFAFEGKNCSGAHIYIMDVSKIKPYFTGIQIMDAINRMYPEQDMFTGSRVSAFNRAMGTDEIREMLMNKKPMGEIFGSYQEGIEEYKEKREKYLLYE